MTFRVPLVRVEGKTYASRPDLSMTPERFAGAAPLEREARDQIARDAERRYGLGDCLYFYAGYACPDFGDVVLAYAPELSASANGNASSFDTGGMFRGYIKGAGLTTATERDALVSSDLCQLDQWRARLDAWIEGYFTSVDDYLNGTRAHTDDPSGRLLHPENLQRAWMYEVRLHTDVPLFDRLVFAIVRREFLERVFAHATGAGALHDRLLSLIAANQIIVTDSLGPDPCTEAASRIAGYVHAHTPGATS